jgi:probable phosphomutase (TIGR03848 family)
MAAAILLVRHATHPLVGRVLCGRMPGVQLDAAGRDQAARLGTRLSQLTPAAIYTSPQERCRETAAAIGQACGLAPHCDAALDEIEFGDWTGLGFDRLAENPGWARWNAERSDARPPGGESMREVQSRATAGLERLRREQPDAMLVAVSHADVIKAVLMDCLGLTLDAYARFDVDPASVSAVVLWDGGGKVLRMNEGVG